MKLAILGDLQLVSPDEPRDELRRRRKHFADAWPSFRPIADRIRKESPDLILSVGDLVDWYSVENRDYVADLMNGLGIPWEATPGNHDYSVYTWSQERGAYDYYSQGERWLEADRGWKEGGINFDNRTIDVGNTRLILMNSAFSGVLPGTREWLREQTRSEQRKILITHVPVDIPEVRDYILSISPGRELAKYVQSHAPWLFDECVRGRIGDVYSGHLHLPGRITVDGTSMHLLGLSTISVGATYPGMGQVTFLNID
ncbi:metallophosphoesterase family protein [Cohnella fermenti]|nr:metallophosphoesterase [Cohnella fermenti]